jgi:biotin carboxylase
MKILILGAGVMQGPAIRGANEMGVETFVVDGDPAASELRDAHHFEQIDLKDFRAIENYARANQVDGVMTIGTDFSASAAWVAERLGLPGIPYEAALDASDKGRMRKKFDEAGVPSPAFVVVETADAFRLPFDFPAVVKPVDNMGARGCRRADDAAELESALRDALSFSRSGRAIVEEYMDGPEFSVDAMVQNGEVAICGLADRHIFFPPYFIEMGHTMPSSCSAAEQAELLDVFKRGIRALGIKNGAAKGDLKLDKRGAMVGEIAARLSGGYMSGWTYPYSSGVELPKCAVACALGKRPEDFGLSLAPSRNWTSAERAFISIPGRVAEIAGLAEARNTQLVKDIFLRASPGSRLRFPENNVGKAGNSIAASPSRTDAVAAAEKAARSILIRLACPDDETDSFLNTKNSFPPDAYSSPESKDWMGRTLGESLDALRALAGLKLENGLADLPDGARAALFRGGYQGAVYWLEKYQYISF